MIGARGGLPACRNATVGNYAFDPTRRIQQTFKARRRDNCFPPPLCGANLRMAVGDGSLHVVLRVEFDGDRFGGKFASALSHERWSLEYDGALVAVDFQATAGGAHGLAACLR